MEVTQEYKRIKELFNDTDEKQLHLLDGAFWECARLRVELDELNQIVNDSQSRVVLRIQLHHSHISPCRPQTLDLQGLNPLRQP